MQNFDRMVGDIRITRIEESCGPLDPAHWFGARLASPEFAAELPWMAPGHYDPASRMMVSSIHTWVLQLAGKTILIDTCCGNHKPRPGWPLFDMLDTPYIERLQAIGIAPGDVDLVMCTHLHVDHVGWNTREENGRWVPTFPNARYLMSRADLDYYAWKVRQPGTMELEINAYNDSVLPIVEAGRHDFLDGSETLEKGLSLMPVPGHTPGSMAVVLESAGQRAFFAGDAIHFPIQVPLWHWPSQIDADPEQGVASRRRILEHCAGHDAMLLPAHFVAPHGCHVRENGDQFAIDFSRMG